MKARFGTETWNRALATFASALFVAYLAWRVSTTSWTQPFSVFFLLLELFGGVSFALFVYSTWNLDHIAPPEPRYSTQKQLAIFITTYNEDEHVLLPVVAAAAALQPVHETWILDDGDRSWVKEMAAELGLTYVTRDDHSHAKAGNINHALGLCQAELIGFLDADHIPSEGFLAQTVAYFDDPDVALVQTPQDFYNTESFEFVGDYGEEEMFYRTIQPGKNRWDGAFWCGTSAVLRRSALLSVGGVSTDSVTEDFMTTIRFHSSGWKTVFHNEVVARGLAPSTYADYLVQRKRWAAGGMQIIRSSSNPAWASGLALKQRLSHLASLMGWFEGLRTIGYVILAVGVVITNASPVTADLKTFIIAHVVVLVATQITLHRMSRGRYNLWANALFDYLRIPITLSAMGQLITGDRLSFQVTHKGSTGSLGERANPPPPASLVVMLVVSQLAWFFYLLRGVGVIPGETKPQALFSAIALLVNSTVIALALRRIQRGDYGDERRRARRFGRTVPVAVNGERFDLSRPSTSGGFIEGQPRLGKQIIYLATREGAVPIECWVARHDETGTTVEFAPGQWISKAHLARSLFSTSLAIAHLPVRPVETSEPTRRSDDTPPRPSPPQHHQISGAKDVSP